MKTTRRQRPLLLMDSKNDLASSSKKSISSDAKIDGDNTNTENLHIFDKNNKTTYLKGQILGKGGSARVFELTNLSTGKTYACKIVPKNCIRKSKLEKEINLHRNLVHSHVVRFHHYFEDDENFCIVMENCAKKSLLHVMKRRKMLTEPEVRFYLHQLAGGLRYIHANQIVHRDLKLGNIFLSECMTVKIGDFGLATHLDPKSTNQIISICGTPNYIAPEVLSGKGHGYEADLWAMGCIMYAMLVGQPPFETSSVSETYSRITHNMYVIPQSISRPARSLIHQLLASDPRHRLTLDQLLKHDFFKSGHMPASLPASCCYEQPNFNLEPSAFDQLFLDRSIERVEEYLPESSKNEIVLKSKTRGEWNERDPPDSIKENRPAVSHVLPVVNVVSAVRSHLYAALNACLTTAPREVSSNPCPVPYNPLFISKWIDYSNKYGFGFQLSDRSVGIRFNDGTGISYSGDRSRLDFQDLTGRMSSHSINAMPLYLKDKWTLLHYFARYMDENLSEGDDSQSTAPAVDTPRCRSSFIHMKRWVRTPKAIIMQLDNKTFQINFFKDHTKIVLSASTASSTSCLIHYWVTYINSDRTSSTYRLSDISHQGCEPKLREKLAYALMVLGEFAQLDAQNNSCRRRTVRSVWFLTQFTTSSNDTSIP